MDILLIKVRALIFVHRVHFKKIVDLDRRNEIALNFLISQGLQKISESGKEKLKSQQIYN
jgi:hypothetical protein